VCEIRADKWVDGKHVAFEERPLTMRMYFRNELVLMLRAAGFENVDVRAGYTGEQPTPGRRVPGLHRLVKGEADERPDGHIRHRIGD
jgi:hypothetical protein